MKYTKEEVFAVLLAKVAFTDGVEKKEFERILRVANANDLNIDKVVDVLTKLNGYDVKDVLKCITNADEDFKNLLFFGCLRVIIADGKISTQEIKQLHYYSECYFEWAATYVTYSLLMLSKDNPELEIIFSEQ